MPITPCCRPAVSQQLATPVAALLVPHLEAGTAPPAAAALMAALIRGFGPQVASAGEIDRRTTRHLTAACYAGLRKLASPAQAAMADERVSAQVCLNQPRNEGANFLVCVLRNGQHFQGLGAARL